MTVVVGPPSKLRGVWIARSVDVLLIDSLCRSSFGEGGTVGLTPTSPHVFAPNQLAERERKGCV